MEKIRSFLADQAEKANSTRGTLIAIVGIYIAYLGYQMLGDTKSGASSMSMPLTIALMVIMGIIGIAVFAYGAFLFWTGWQREKKKLSEENSDKEEQK